MVPAAPVVAAAAPLLSGAVLCAVSLVASARPLAFEWPKLPDFELPKLELPKLELPNLDLPNFGKKDAAPAKKKAPARSPVTGGQVRVRPARGSGPTAQEGDAPTLADVVGQQSQDTISAGAGWKRYPERRMPGANMDGWKKIAKDIAPKI